MENTVEFESKFKNKKTDCVPSIWTSMYLYTALVRDRRLLEIKTALESRIWLPQSIMLGEAIVLLGEKETQWDWSIWRTKKKGRG